MAAISQAAVPNSRMPSRKMGFPFSAARTAPAPANGMTPCAMTLAPESVNKRRRVIIAGLP